MINRYSFINHHFHHSTITIKQKIIINKLVTELLWGHFLLKIVVQMKNVKFRGIPRKKDEFRGKIPWQKPKFRGLARNSAGHGKLWALVMWSWKATNWWCDSGGEIYSNNNTNPKTLTTLTLTLADPHGAFESFCAPAFCDFIRNYSCTVDGAVVTSNLINNWWINSGVGL